MRSTRCCAVAALAVPAVGAVVAVVASLALVVFGAPAFAAAPPLSAPLVIDAGGDTAAWTALASPGATASIVEGPGRDGDAFGLSFDLGRGRTHAIARRAVSIDLPEHYRFVFTLKADCDPNTFEIKFISGENVWWWRLADHGFPRDWKDLPVANPRISFAWGPAGKGMPVHLDAIELAVVSGTGGKGTLWIDEIRVEPRDGDAATRTPLVTASSNAADTANLFDGDATTVWRSAADDREPTITLDFREALEQGGLEVEHAADGFAEAWAVEVSADGEHWLEVRRFTRSDGGLDPVYMPDVYARYVRLRFAPPAGRHAAIGDIRIQPFGYSASLNEFFTAMARRAAPGLYPRYFLGEQSYWTVVGAAGGPSEALINEEGAVEVDAGAFTLEPFVLRDGRLRTWKDSANSVSLDGGDLPIPTVTRRYEGLTLETTAFAAGGADASTLYVRYRLRMERGAPPARLFVALRPFQVLPPWQSLNRTGGVAAVDGIVRDGATIRVGNRRVVAITPMDAFGAAAFEQGDITSFLLRGEVPALSWTTDGFSHASAAMAWNLDLAPGQSRDVWVAVPWTAASAVAGGDAGDAAPNAANNAAPGSTNAAPDAALDALLAATRAEWRAHLDVVGIELPESKRDWQASLRSNLAYVLINRDGAAIQPGSRNYERSWIRDGAMTSAALLELGLNAEVKQFLRWYAGFVGADGWVPCCVDARGADPVPEHDSFGEFIWAVAEVWRFTRDEAFVREMWPHVKAAAGCMGRLRAARLTKEYDAEDKRAFRGLLPESISHEGYSARPVHSYWDQAFALRGFADAAQLAEVVGDKPAAAGLAADAKDFGQSLRESIRLVMIAHRMDVVPASVELADFDPTSTAVSFLLGTDHVYPRDALERSFDKYVVDLRARRGLATRGVGYTAYELRSATALLLLGRKAEAIELLGTLLADQRPPAWNQWPEISWLSPTEPSFLGDLPHTWIGSTYVHAVRTLLVAERDDDGTGPVRGAWLLVGAGIPLDWLADGAQVRGRALPTWYGSLSLRVRRTDAAGAAVRVAVDLEDAGVAADDPVDDPADVSALAPAAKAAPDRRNGAGVRAFTIPDGGIEACAPFGAEVAGATVGGVAGKVERGCVRVSRLPATVVFEYKPRLE